jgi:hypothetical protein
VVAHATGGVVVGDLDLTATAGLPELYPDSLILRVS